MPQAIFVQNGDQIDHIPVADVAVGEVVVQSELVGVAQSAIPAGQVGSLAVTGVYDLPVASLTGWAVGDLAYWDNTAKVATETATGNKLIGKVVLVNSRPGTPYVRVRFSQ